MVQRCGAARDAACKGQTGGAFLQSPDASSRPGARDADGVPAGDGRYRSVFGGAGPGLIEAGSRLGVGFWHRSTVVMPGAGPVSAPPDLVRFRTIAAALADDAN